MTSRTFPHDNLFSVLFSDKRHILAFLDAFLPNCLRPLDTDSASLVDPKLVDEALSARISDILWRFRPKAGITLGSAGSDGPSRPETFLFLLLEHKSHPDRRTLLQILELMLRLWSRYGLESRVLPILLTNTRTPWRSLLAYVTRGKIGLTTEELRAVVARTVGRRGAGIMESLVEQWLEQGRRKGLEEGLERGLEQGLRRLADTVCEVVQVRFGRVPADVEAYIRSRKDLDELRQLHRRALVVANPGELVRGE